MPVINRFHALSLFLILTVLFFGGCEKAKKQPGESNESASSTKSTTGVAKSAMRKSAEPKSPAGEADWDRENWNLVWSDEFDGNKVDLEKWKFETGDWGWGNKEWQNYTNGTNSEVSEGTLKIIAKLQGKGQKAGDYTSSRMNSKFNFTYGRIAVRAKMPELKGNGLWPAIWTLGQNLSTAGWPNCGELDIVEYLSFKPDIVQSAIHTKANNHKNKTQIETGPMELKTTEEEFHIYGVDWNETEIKFFVDTPTNVTLSFERPKEFDANNWPFDKPQYILLNLAVGGWGGTEGVDDSIFPSQMEIDYVRVYQRK